MERDEVINMVRNAIAREANASEGEVKYEHDTISGCCIEVVTPSDFKRYVISVTEKRR